MAKRRVNILVNQKTLKQWDELADTIGISRTALIHNAIKIYELFITNQLNGDQKSNIKEQLEQIKLILTGLQEREHIVNKEAITLEKEIEAIDIDDFHDFNLVAEKILSLLKNWGSLPESTISAHLQYPSWIIWTILKKLKVNKKLKIEKGEWSLYARLE